MKPQEHTRSTDPFADDVGAAAQDNKSDSKAFRSPPKLTSQPSGKLARRRQASAQLTDSPTPKVPSRRKGRAAGDASVPMHPLPTIRPLRRASADMTSQRWDSFPICDDSSDFGDDSDITPPTTPIREVATVPAKTKGTWQQEHLVDDAPRTAPLASTLGFPFVGHSPCSTPTPAQRRRNHRRVPSEGVFAMSTDEESPSSSVSDLFESMQLKRRSPVSIPRQRCLTICDLPLLKGILLVRPSKTRQVLAICRVLTVSSRSGACEPSTARSLDTRGYGTWPAAERTSRE